MSKKQRRRNTSVTVVEKSNPNYTVIMHGPSAVPQMMPRNMRAYLSEGYRNKTAFRVIGQIARSGAGIKWKHYTDESKQREVNNSELLSLWNRPNQKQGGTKFRENLLGYYCLTGNSYILGINAQQNPRAPYDELHILRPDLVKVHIGDGLEPDYYEFGIGYPYKRYDDAFIMHSKLFAANDDVYGLSPIEVAAMLVDIQKASQKWNLSLMSNMAAPSGAWVTKQVLNNPDYQNLKKEIREKFSGPRNAREPVVLHGGVEWQSMSMTPMELDFLSSDEKTDRDIAGIFFNFPVFLLGLADATFANQEEAKHYLYTDIIFPIWDMFRDDINRWLTPRYGGYLDYDRDDVETIQERIQAAKAAVSDRAAAEFTGGTTTFAEARELQGKPTLPVKDFVLVQGIPVHVADLDEYIAAMAGKTINPPAPPPAPMLPPTKITEEPPDEDDPPMKRVPAARLSPLLLPRSGSGTRRQTKVLDLETTQQKEAYFKSVEVRRAKWEAEIATRLQDYFKSEQKTMTAAVERSDDTESAQDRVSHAIDTLGQGGALKHLIVGIYQDVGTDSGDAVLQELKGELVDYSQKDDQAAAGTLNLYAPDVLVYLLTMAGEKVTYINGTTKALLQSALEEGVQQGESIAQLVKRIDDLYVFRTPERIQTIVETEVHSASEYGTYMGAKSSGLVLNKVWLSTNDGHTRQDHRDADGQEVPLDELFVVGDSKLMYPGDPSGSAKETILCRCTHYLRRVKDQPLKMIDLTGYVNALPKTPITKEQYREILRGSMRDE